MIRETLTALAESEPCSYRQLAAMNGWNDSTTYSRLAELRQSGYVRANEATNNKPVYYALSDMGRRYLVNAKGDVALPRAVSKMAGVWVPPQWPAVIR